MNLNGQQCRLYFRHTVTPATAASASTEKTTAVLARINSDGKLETIGEAAVKRFVSDIPCMTEARKRAVIKLMRLYERDERKVIGNAFFSIARLPKKTHN